ncbi:DNA-directed RNA polymerase II subunit RPB1 [Frankliniella fusca]|uniref:DNA-directed RNA polymerase II subunit RPB1 n=1 Tax=Frankliniella fusca TaxID=407009 RepID=A0AAE1HYB6_9NEOP|nr:DNA-directed RNA polymerase II subunit RPB1 [Frankliniella fusca]
MEKSGFRYANITRQALVEEEAEEEVHSSTLVLPLHVLVHPPSVLVHPPRVLVLPPLRLGPSPQRPGPSSRRPGPSSKSPPSSPRPGPSSQRPSPSPPRPGPTATPSRPLRPSALVSNAPRLPPKITSPFAGFGSPEIEYSSQVAKSADAHGVKFAKTILDMASSSAATCTACGESCSVSDQCKKCRVSLHGDCAEGGLCLLCQKGDRIAAERKEAHSNIRAQAKKMVLASKNRFSPAEVGDSVAVPIPDVDRSKAGERNVIMRIMEEEDGFYTLANKDGTLDTKLIRSQFQVCKGDFIAEDDVSTTLKSLRALASAGAHMGGQGFERCHCASGCKTNRCSCKKSGKICNSKCHSGNNCSNK